MLVRNKFLIVVFTFFLAGCTSTEKPIEKETWEESATLVREVVISEDGQTGEFVFRMGDNGKFGIGEYSPFIADEIQKFMWHFWGEEKTLTKPVKITATSRKTKEKITVFSNDGSSMLSPNNGASHHIPSSISLPSEGLWKLEVFFEEELFGSIVINVKDK
jgi:Domain of unknown function (DUF4871)